jgi:hypothetical protein
MKTMAQFVEDQIHSAAELHEALTLAMKLEFSTIPPYLCAQWSIKPDGDPSRVGRMIQKIVIQEMYHFALAGNMLSAINGPLDFAKPDFIQCYPTNKLPGDIPQMLPVDLRPLSAHQLEVFMQIEEPEYLTTNPTIGAFYDTIWSGFKTVGPGFNMNANFVIYGEAVSIKSMTDVQNAITRIKTEGEGTSQTSPDEPDGTLAHYFTFRGIFKGKTYVRQPDGTWDYTGPPDIKMPSTHAFPTTSANSTDQTVFNQTLTKLLLGLQSCWTDGVPIDGFIIDDGNTPVNMPILQSQGTALISQGIRPAFVWTD